MCGLGRAVGIGILWLGLWSLAVVPASAATFPVSGTVTDASVGWGLYSSIGITGGATPTWAWTDAGGTYIVNLEEGIAYTFTVTPRVAGYQATSVVVGPFAGPVIQDFALAASGCTAPGYYYTGGAYETFDSLSLPVGWTVADNAGTGAVWTFNDPGGRGNLTGGTGGFAGADSDEAGSVNMDTELRTPAMDFSTYVAVSIQFKTLFNSYSGSEFSDVDVSTNGAAGPWTNVWRKTADYGPATENVDITALAAGQANVMVRFRYYNANYDWYWEIDDVIIGPPVCNPAPGGIIAGFVWDAVTMVSIPGAVVTSSATGETFTTGDDGFYLLYGPAGVTTITADKALYTTATMPGIPTVAGVTTALNIALTSGHLTVAPMTLDVFLGLGQTTTADLLFTSDGASAVAYEIKEVDKGAVPLRGTARQGGPVGAPGRFDPCESIVAPEKEDGKDTRDTDVPGKKPSGTRLAAGDVLATWTPTQYPWGICYDMNAGTVWVGSPGSAWGGTNTVYEYTTAGVATGRQYPFTFSTTGNGPGDLCFNWNTGRIWAMNINSPGDNSIYEIDPATGPTGLKITPGFSTSMRGVAYDPTGDTYFAGSWNDLSIHHFNAAGTILSSVNVGLSISGLAYNPETQHLFVMVNDSPNLVYVLDAANAYNPLGNFSIVGFSDYSGAGMEFDCDGNLWVVDQSAATVSLVSSGESFSGCYTDVPWLSEAPVGGTIPAAGTQSVAVGFDAAAVPQTGVYSAELHILTDAPQGKVVVPVTMTVCELSCSATVPAAATMNGAIQFQGLYQSDCPGAPTFAWDFGDGGTAATQDAAHAYTAEGTFTWTFTVTVGTITCTTTGTGTVTSFDVYLFDDYGRAMLCLNSVTGDFTYTILTGYGAGRIFSGVSLVSRANGVLSFRTAAGLPYSLTGQYLERYFKGKASFMHRPLRISSTLYDSNTLNNPPGC